MTETTASARLHFSQEPFEIFSTMESIMSYCAHQKESSADLYRLPQDLRLRAGDDTIILETKIDSGFQLNNTSFSQLCDLAEVWDETILRLSPETAAQVLNETLPTSEEPARLLVTGNTVRAIDTGRLNTESRNWNIDILKIIETIAPDFFSPQYSSRSGQADLYCGEKGLRCFFISESFPLEISDQEFTPAFGICHDETEAHGGTYIQALWYYRNGAVYLPWDNPDWVPNSIMMEDDNISLSDILRTFIARFRKEESQEHKRFAKALRRVMNTEFSEKSSLCRQSLLRDFVPNESVKSTIQMVNQSHDPTIFSAAEALFRLTHGIEDLEQRCEAWSRISEQTFC